MGNPPEASSGGSFIWYELMTPDPAAAGTFYNEVVGFTFAEPENTPGIDYRMIVRDDGGLAGGVLGLDAAMLGEGMTPRWMPYLYVENVDAAVAAIEAEGGTSFVPPADIPGVGRFAMIGDPQGVPIYLMTPTPPPGDEGKTSDVFDPATPQHVRWNELASPDQAGSLDFYARHFGFACNEKMPMGDFGDYAFIDHGGQRIGAIMQRFNPEQPALWLMYFGVPSLTAAKERVERAGGTIVMGPHQVPGGDWIVVGIDPQGAGFGLVGPKGE